MEEKIEKPCKHYWALVFDFKLQAIAEVCFKCNLRKP